MQKWIAFATAAVFLVGIALACSHQTTSLYEPEETEKKPNTSFAGADEDHNGRVTSQEVDDMLADQFGLLDSDASKTLEKKETSRKPAWYGEADKNKDGKTDIMEFMSASDAKFSSADKDHDGTLSESEYRDFPVGN